MHLVKLKRPSQHGYLIRMSTSFSVIQKLLLLHYIKLSLYAQRSLSVYKNVTSDFFYFQHCLLTILKQAESSGLKIDWLPSYSDLTKALKIYSYLLDSQSKLSSDVDMIEAVQNFRQGSEFFKVAYNQA